MRHVIVDVPDVNRPLKFNEYKTYLDRARQVFNAMDVFT